ncbi:hypothetical protein FB45DRAFT_1003382 [Roridomyces roridus]|uniref:MYND-type domain-containing protein n=1 Tax=Roridomyces roridus TaxID=1738132 RepID=A0AAD7BY61_9AGAR|nr:hypothetical protein FB45DRAFT_1003382 [Roridomyces roridus]
MVNPKDVDLAELRAETEDVLKDFLLHYLPSLTIHWGDGSGSTVVSALDAHEFRLPALSPALRDAWKNFAALARDRAEFSKSFDSTGIVRMKACDNTLCTAFDARTLFKRSGCATAFYCSVRCQAIDWNDGHRAACKHHDSLLRGHFGRTSTSPTTSRQRAVMRSILHRDYLDLKLHIYTEAVRSMHLSGDPDAGYFVMFDYTRGGVIVDVHSLALKSRDLIWLWELEPEWDEIEARAERSGGRMTIHVMRAWVVPLRSSNGMVHDELVNLAWDEAYCNWEDGLQSRLEALVVSPQNNFATHILPCLSYKLTPLLAPFPNTLAVVRPTVPEPMGKTIEPVVPASVSPGLQAAPAGAQRSRTWHLVPKETSTGWKIVVDSLVAQIVLPNFGVFLRILAMSVARKHNPGHIGMKHRIRTGDADCSNHRLTQVCVGGF